VPAALVAQLKPDGRMVIPVGPEHGDQSLARVELDAQGRQVRTELMGVRYVPLIPQSCSWSQMESYA
jgi:protein-L-isoaspartate(D-aspartate) O-methyltransferase